MTKRPCIENRTFDEIKVGDEASLQRTLTWQDVELFAAMSGDVNPAHIDEEFARSDMFHKVIAHGMWGGSLISTLLGTELPGPGTIYISQSLHFHHPIGLNDTVTVTVRVTDKEDARKRVTLDCIVVGQSGNTAISGEAIVLAPAEKICRERVQRPIAHVEDSTIHSNRDGKVRLQEPTGSESGRGS